MSKVIKGSLYILHTIILVVKNSVKEAIKNYLLLKNKTKKSMCWEEIIASDKILINTNSKIEI